MKDVLHPELEANGPDEFDIAKVEQLLLDGQKNDGVVKGQVVCDHLKSNNMLESCLGLRDLEEIQKKGIVFFRRYFKDKAIFAWQSVVWDRYDDLHVPYLRESGDEVVLYWRWLDRNWYDYGPVFRLAS